MAVAVALKAGFPGRNGSGGADDAVTTLVGLATAAERDFGLTVAQCSAPGPSEASVDVEGRAFDASGPVAAMNAFAAFVDERLSAIAELIHNPNGSIKNGRRVGPTFWGEKTWAAHAGHVHVAV